MTNQSKSTRIVNVGITKAIDLGAVTAVPLGATAIVDLGPSGRSLILGSSKGRDCLVSSASGSGPVVADVEYVGASARLCPFRDTPTSL